MLNTLKSTRVVVIKHIMQRICDDELSVDAGMRLIVAFDEEYQLALDSMVRFEKTCYQITDNRTVVMGP